MGISKRKMREVYHAIAKYFINNPESVQLYNDDTIAIWKHVAADLELSEEVSDEIRKAIWWGFDDYSVEEAGEFFEAFKVVLRV